MGYPSGRCMVMRRPRRILAARPSIPAAVLSGLSVPSISAILPVLALLAGLVGLVGQGMALGADPAEPLLRNVPPSVGVVSSVEVPAAQTQAIGRKLGGQIQRLTNSVVRVHGQAVQVNVIAAVDEAHAEAIHEALAKIKPPPFCLRKHRMVVEYVGRNLDPALARKTSYELGVLLKPDAVRYRVVAELAAVEQADYMACNPLFNQFLAIVEGQGQGAGQREAEAIRRIGELSRGFTFGRRLALRNPALDGTAVRHLFQPAASAARASGAAMVYTFEELPKRQNVPYVTATIETMVDNTGFRAAPAAPAGTLTASTPRWPADAPTVRALAREITAGRQTNEAKALAILEWLSPGRNLKYAGQTGSRWGTLKVLDQKFGHCWDFSDCFITLARAAGVPCRQVGGWFYGSGGHIWAEFYRDAKGWQHVDPTGGGKLKCGIYHIPYFTSDDGEMPVLYVARPKIDVLDGRGT